MLKTKVFIKKTRKGGIVKIVREHYLRDDVGCGAEQCETCVLNKRALSKKPQSFSTLCDFPHYILPDTNVVLRQVYFLIYIFVKEIFFKSVRFSSPYS